MLDRWLPENVSTYGRDIDWLFHLIYWITGITAILVFATMIAFLWCLSSYFFPPCPLFYASYRRNRFPSGVPPDVAPFLLYLFTTVLPADRIPTSRDWGRLSGKWTKRIDQRIAELKRLRAGLTQCIGCGCLSIDKCELANPADRAGRKGPGPRYWVG